MGARLNRVDPRDFMPPAKACRPRKVPREVRQQIYQLDLTIRETKVEINRLLSEYGMAPSSWCDAVARIRRERGS